MTKGDLEDILVLYKDQIESFKAQIVQLREDKIALQEQNFRLQEGLLNIRAPEAYRDMVLDRAGVEDTSEEARQRQSQISDIQRQFMRKVEAPLFTDADEMLRLLSPALNDGGVQAESLHHNDES